MSYHTENHYQNGRLAFIDGKPLISNPHKRYTDERTQWSDGWHEASIDYAKEAIVACGEFGKRG